jgi:hypothetical protein
VLRYVEVTTQQRAAQISPRKLEDRSTPTLGGSRRVCRSSKFSAGKANSRTQPGSARRGRPESSPGLRRGRRAVVGIAGVGGRGGGGGGAGMMVNTSPQTERITLTRRPQSASSSYRRHRNDDVGGGGERGGGGVKDRARRDDRSGNWQNNTHKEAAGRGGVAGRLTYTYDEGKKSEQPRFVRPWSASRSRATRGSPIGGHPRARSGMRARTPSKEDDLVQSRSP